VSSGRSGRAPSQNYWPLRASEVSYANLFDTPRSAATSAAAAGGWRQRPMRLATALSTSPRSRRPFPGRRGRNDEHVLTTCRARRVRARTPRQASRAMSPRTVSSAPGRPPPCDRLRSNSQIVERRADPLRRLVDHARMRCHRDLAEAPGASALVSAGSLRTSTVRSRARRPRGRSRPPIGPAYGSDLVTGAIAA